jgi:hypothetical protein
LKELSGAVDAARAARDAQDGTGAA